MSGVCLQLCSFRADLNNLRQQTRLGLIGCIWDKQGRLYKFHCSDQMFSALTLHRVAAKSLRVGAVKSGAFFQNNPLFLFVLLFLLLLLPFFFSPCGLCGVTGLHAFFSFIRISAVALCVKYSAATRRSGSRHQILSSHVQFFYMTTRVKNDSQTGMTSSKNRVRLHC